MKKINSDRLMRFGSIAFIALAVVVGVYLYVSSFSSHLSAAEQSRRASLGGLIPVAALLIERLAMFLLKKRRA